MTLSSPYYLFSFYDEQGMRYYNVILNDDSTYPNYYNQFVLDEPNDVDFNITGYYTYTVYEQSSPTNTDPENAGRVLEVGRMRVYPESELIEEDFYSEGWSSNEIYNYSS